MNTARKRMIAAPLAIGTAFALAACSDDSAGPEVGTTVEDVAEAEPEEEPLEEEPLEEEPLEEEAVADGPIGEGADLMGRTVTVSGEIEELVSDTAFTIGAGDPVLVLSAVGDFAPLGLTLDETLVADDTVLQVTGTVRQLVIVDLEEEFGVDYDDEALAEFEGEAVIVADQVDTLAGEELTLAGEVSEIMSTVAFRLEGAGWDVVVLDAEQAAVAQGDFVQVLGTVRELNIVELEEEFGVDLDDAVYEPYEGDLVLVAESVVEAVPATVPAG